ncbi:MAG: oxidoreductase [Candidatus Micrarchaeia archaeon]|jgi:coenzyme F420-reducing hydrogenase gamma subunit
MKKKTLGVFSLTGCAGDQMQLLNLEGLLPVLAQEIDITHFPMAREENADGPFDIALVEGAVANTKQIEEIKAIREKSKILVAFGTCACFGGVPNIANFIDGKITCMAYPPGTNVEHICATGIDTYVPVDFQLRGCPVSRREVLDTLHSLAVGKIPVVESRDVCSECRTRENKCLFPQAPCMGPISLAGCEAVCTSNGFVCEGCRGPTDDANIAIFVQMCRQHGLSIEEIRKKLIAFAGSSKKYGSMLCIGELE